MNQVGSKLSNKKCLHLNELLYHINLEISSIVTWTCQHLDIKCLWCKILRATSFKLTAGKKLGKLGHRTLHKH